MTSNSHTGKPLHQMYETVPRNYDLLNHLMTLGFDRHWRKVAAREGLRNSPVHLLDLCTGTGDLAFEIARQAPPQVQIYGLDFSEPMLAVAKKKSSGKERQRVRFQNGDAAAMPFGNGFFQTVTIGFGFRNLTFENPRSEQNLRDIHRVLEPGGWLVIAETSQPRPGLYRHFTSWITRRVFPLLGGLVSGQWKAYQYLGYSTANFFSPRELEDFLKGYGFRRVKEVLFFGGISGVFVYEKATDRPVRS